MAEVVVSFLIEQLGELIVEKAALTGAEDMIRWIEDEFESFIPQFDRVQALPQPPAQSDLDVEQIRNVIVRAQDLIDTYPKTILQTKMAAMYKKPIHWIKLRRIVKELRRVKEKINRAKDQLWRFAHLQLPLSRWRGEQHLPESREVMPASGAPSIVDQDVPSYLRNCIYYFLLFPADFKVPARRLIVLWVAEGLIRPKQYDTEPVEHIAERYLNELIARGVVRCTDRRRNGDVKTCQLKDSATRQAWLAKAKDDNFLRDGAEDVRRLVDHNGTGDAPSIQIHGNPSISRSVPKYRDVISFLSFDTQEGSKPGEDIGDFIHKCISAGCFQWMRVLDLERVFRPKLPKTLGKLIGLKYLGLRWTYLEDLPKFVNELLNLEVLDVKHTYISVLPKSIWSMQYLRHLYLSETYRTRFPDQPSRVSLTALQTLWGASIDEDTCVTDGLDTLLDIRKLGLSCRSRQSEDSKMPNQLKAINKWISNLKFLESLSLKSRDEHGRAADLPLSSLEQNRNLSTVYLLGKLNPLVVSEFPVSLTDITLSGSKLDLDPMEFLARLPNLQSLRLLAHSVTHNKMHCSRRGFRLLKLLYIWNLEDLEEWEADEGSLPSLEELEFRSCDKLKKYPVGLQHVSTLQKFRLTSMPVEFIDEIKNNKSLWDKAETVDKEQL